MFYCVFYEFSFWKQTLHIEHIFLDNCLCVGKTFKATFKNIFPVQTTKHYEKQNVQIQLPVSVMVHFALYEMRVWDNRELN